MDREGRGKYPNQRIFVVRIRGYASFVETGAEIFLKTIILSRSATRRYIKEEKANEKENKADEKQYEADILSSFESGKWESVPDLQEVIARYTCKVRTENAEPISKEVP